MIGRLKRAFGKKAVPAPSTDSGITVELTVGQQQGCAAGVIMPDGTLVRCEGEPPMAKIGNRYKPYNG